MVQRPDAYDALRRAIGSGNHIAARELCRDATERNPDDHGAWELLAESCELLGDLAESETARRQVVRLCPREASQRAQLALCLARQKKLDQAVAEWRLTIRQEPALEQAHHNLGVALIEQGKTDEGIKCLEEAIRLWPEYLESIFSLGAALLGLGRAGDAHLRYRQALALRPDSAAAYHGIGKSLAELKRWPEAVFFLRQATRLQPDAHDLFNSLALALVEVGEFAKAEEAYHRALDLNPRDVPALTNLAVCLAHQGRFAEAFAAYDVALAFEPDSVTTRWNRSILLLQTGQIEEGFREYEWRWRRARSPMRQMPKPMPDGSDLAGKTVLLWTEQGLGDAIQFVRYAMMLKSLGARVILECPSPLARVLPMCPGVDHFIVEGQSPPEFDFHVPAMSLPRLFATRLDTIPAPIPYLRPDAAKVDYWRKRLDAAGAMKIGISWQGNPHHQWDRHRSMPLAELAPLGRLEGVKLFSLQRGPGVEQIARNPAIGLIELLDPALGDAEGWADIAAIMANLDLVISVDTATGHLAGALGADTWLALSAISDWRWMTGRANTPWYPMMRLFRQPNLGDWSSVISTMVATLQTRLQARAATPKARRSKTRRPNEHRD